MKSLFGFHSIRHKLLLGVLMTTLIALFVSGAILIVYDLRDYRNRTLEDLRTQAGLIGQSTTAAIQFDDREVANQALSLLRLRPRIIAAAIYTPDGKVFAHYMADGQLLNGLSPLPKTTVFDLENSQLGMPKRILFDNEILGTVYLLAKYPFYERLMRDISIILAITVLALAISMLLSFWIQSRITRPILTVTKLAHGVVEHQDYSARAEKISNDEIGYLVEAFNNMLAEIEQRTNDLQLSNQYLNQEIEERNLAEKTLQENELRYRTLVTALTSIVWQADKNGHFLAEQPQWQHYTRQFYEQYAGLGWLKAFHEDDQPGLKAHWYHASDSGSPYEVQLRLWHAASEDYRYVKLHAVPLVDENGTTLEWIGIIDDIHEQVQSNEEIKRLNAELEHRVEQRTAELEHANKELEAFSYSVSHDLRSPLRSIDGFSQALLEDYEKALDETGRSYLNRVRAAAQRMGVLIDDLLKLSRVSRAEINCRDLNLSEIVQTIVNELKDSDPERQVSINIEPDVNAYGDVQLLYVALENLLNNAWKYSSKKAAAKIEFGTDNQNDTPCYYVKDNGAGFDMAYAGRLFGAFQRLHDTHDFPGTGVGLATVQRIIHRHGGHIWVEAEVDNGAVFYFTLPLSKEETDEQQTYFTG
ncbi:ATP-binding protein [Methylophaga sp. OBS4]|uniref:ATP-binding protein n=1 Tax=Methylophaga sp. OBS4 TaxID=2991935 RepID=UPI002251E70C|nr:ATP-binding protein [Methylophaga sp. OBS4]MCX4187561.1 ATP-binding protein [Methylophaga sp. OBS4]